MNIEHAKIGPRSTSLCDQNSGFHYRLTEKVLFVNYVLIYGSGSQTVVVRVPVVVRVRVYVSMRANLAYL